MSLHRLSPRGRLQPLLIAPFLLLMSAVASALTSAGANERQVIDLAQASLIARQPWPQVALDAISANPKIIALQALYDNAAHTRAEDAFLGLDPASPGFVLENENAPGGRCANALPLSVEQPFAYRLRPNAAIWFRVVSAADQITLLDTVGSHADSALQVYRDCQGELIASADDNYGLQARLSLPKQARPQSYFVRLQNLGGVSMQALRLQVRAGAVVSGRLQRSNNAAPPTTAVRFFDERKNYLGSDFTDAAGNFALAVPENVSSIYLRTQKFSTSVTWLNSVYPSGICRDQSALEMCVLDQAQLVATVPNTVTELAPLTLLEGATLEGNVALPGPFAGGSILGVTAVGVELFSATLDSVGRYRVSGLYPETVRVYARAGGANSAVHANLPCSGPNLSDCPLAQATPVELQIATNTRIDFALQPAGGIDVALPQGVQRVDVFRANGTLAAGYQSFFGSNLFVPLAAGSYRVRMSVSGHFASLWPSTNCIFPCLNELSTVLPFSLALGEVKPLSFTLRRLPTVRVSLRDALTQAPITDGESQLFASFPFPALTTPGGVALHTTVEPGAYYVRGGSARYVDQAAPGVTCELFHNVVSSCPGAQAMVVDLNSPEVIDVSFNLARSGAVEGASRFFGVQALDASLMPAGYGGNYSGLGSDRYRLSDLTPNQYFFGIAANEYFPQLYANVNCAVASGSGSTFSLCASAMATSLHVNPGETVSGVNFSPRARSAIRGRLVNQQTGAPIAGVVLDFWQAQPGTAPRIFYSVRSGADGSFEAPVNAPAWVSTDQAMGYSNAVYPNILCAHGSAASGGCSVSAGVLVEPDRSLTGEGVLFALAPVLFQHGFEN